MVCYIQRNQGTATKAACSLTSSGVSNSTMPQPFDRPAGTAHTSGSQRQAYWLKEAALMLCENCCWITAGSEGVADAEAGGLRGVTPPTRHKHRSIG